MNGVSIIIPYVNEHKVKIAAAACQEFAPEAGVDFEVLIDRDMEGIGCTKMVKRLTDKSKYDKVFFIGEDTVPQQGFLAEALKVLNEKTGGKGVTFVHDKISDPFRHCHWLASKELLPLIGGEFFHTGYWHSYSDDELAERALELGLYSRAHESIVMHDHPLITGIDNAEHSHNKIRGGESWFRDLQLYGRRHTNNWVTPGPDYFRVGIGIPLSDKLLDKAFFISFVLLHKNFDWAFQVPARKTMHRMSDTRNSLLLQALMDGCTHQIQMDTDQIYPPDTLDRLLSHRDKDIVGTRVHRRYPPFDVIMFRGEPDKLYHVPDEECFSGELVRVAGTGTGCIMINLRILQDMHEPWFREGSIDIDGFNDGGHMGEDVYFTMMANKCGKEVYVDTGIAVDHMTQYLVNGSTYHLYKALTGHTWRPETVPIPIEERMSQKKYREALGAAKAHALGVRT